MPGPKYLEFARGALAGTRPTHQGGDFPLGIFEGQGRPLPDGREHCQSLWGQPGGDIFPGLHFIFQVANHVGKYNFLTKRPEEQSSPGLLPGALRANLPGPGVGQTKITLAWLQQADWALKRQAARNIERSAKWVRGGRARDLRSNGPPAHFYDTGHLLAQMTYPLPTRRMGWKGGAIGPDFSAIF